MAKKIVKDEEGNDQVEAVNQPDGAPVVHDTDTAPSREVLSHQWQKDSASINTNTLAGYNLPQGQSILDKIDTPEKVKAREEEGKKKPEKAKLSKEEYERRTALDVSDPKYINPSLEHHEVE